MYRIPESWNVKRTPLTPKEEWGNYITWGLPFEEIFDWDILFSLCVNIGDNRILLVGGPLYDLKKLISFSDGEKKLKHTFYDLDRVQLTIVEADCKTLYLKDLEIPVEQPSETFKDMGVVTVMMKNEPISWIRDWITWYHKEHGIQGFCVHNNLSTDYTYEELKEGLQGIEGCTVEVVDFPMPMGPKVPPYWHSDWGKYVMYETFKYRYGWCARYVLNHDIDELTVVPNGTLEDLIKQMEQQQVGALIYGNRNIDSYNKSKDCNAIDLPVDERSFPEYYYYSKELNSPDMIGNRYSIVKWVVLPQYSMDSQWKCHDVTGQIRKAQVDKNSGGIYFAHFYSMQTKNRNFNDAHSKRNTALVPKENLFLDEVLKEKLSKVFNYG